MILYIKKDQIPEDAAKAKNIALASSQYDRVTRWSFVSHHSSLT